MEARFDEATKTYASPATTTTKLRPAPTAHPISLGKGSGTSGRAHRGLGPRGKDTTSPHAAKVEMMPSKLPPLAQPLSPEQPSPHLGTRRNLDFGGPLPPPHGKGAVVTKINRSGNGPVIPTELYIPLLRH